MGRPDEIGRKTKAISVATKLISNGIAGDGRPGRILFLVDNLKLYM